MFQLASKPILCMYNLHKHFPIVKVHPRSPCKDQCITNNKKFPYIKYIHHVRIELAAMASKWNDIMQTRYILSLSLINVCESCNCNFIGTEDTPT